MEYNFKIKEIDQSKDNFIQVSKFLAAEDRDAAIIENLLPFYGEKEKNVEKDLTEHPTLYLDILVEHGLPWDDLWTKTEELNNARSSSGEPYYRVTDVAMQYLTDKVDDVVVLTLL